MKTKEEWVDKAMGSLDGAGRAELNPAANEELLKRMQDAGYRIDPVKPAMVWKIAAVILLLISLNVFTIVYYHKSAAGSSSPASSVASEYFSYIDHYNL
jgi:hypothetical protein